MLIQLVRLFRTLSSDPEICSLVKHLDVRFFPLAARGGERYDLDGEVREAIKHMINLESLVWTVSCDFESQARARRGVLTGSSAISR